MLILQYENCAPNEKNAAIVLSGSLLKIDPSRISRCSEIFRRYTKQIISLKIAITDVLNNKKSTNRSHSLQAFVKNNRGKWQVASSKFIRLNYNLTHLNFIDQVSTP